MVAGIISSWLILGVLTIGLINVVKILVRDSYRSRRDVIPAPRTALVDDRLAGPSTVRHLGDTAPQQLRPVMPPPATRRSA